VTLADLARLCDVFYIGGTKVGAMFGEAVVISNPAIAQDFRYMIKQRGAMLAKGWLLGLQFEALLENGLYFEISAHANRQADKIRKTLAELGYSLYIPNESNQIFPILPDALLEKLSKNFTFAEMHRVDETHRVVRFCTSWATKPENADALCNALVEYAAD
jgi:threonine aldolase